MAIQPKTTDHSKWVIAHAHDGWDRGGRNDGDVGFPVTESGCALTGKSQSEAAAQTATMLKTISKWDSVQL
jgi:hypothetical protein